MYMEWEVKNFKDFEQVSIVCYLAVSFCYLNDVWGKDYRGGN
jgi:hypothetical protein